MTRYTQTKIRRKKTLFCIPCGFDGHACAGHGPCEYCGEDPCACPVFDIDPDDGGPDNPTCPDDEGEPTFTEFVTYGLMLGLCL